MKKIIWILFSIMIGCSSSAGTLLIDGDSRMDMPEWSSMLQTSDIQDQAVSCSTIPQVLNRLEYSTFELSAIEIGINDIGLSYETGNIDVVKENYKILVDHYSKSSKRVLLFAVYPLEFNRMQAFYAGRYSSSEATSRVLYSNAKVIELNAYIKNLCDGEKIIYCDIYTPSIDPDGSLNAEYTCDGIHGSNKMNILMADYINYYLSLENLYL